MGDNNQYEYPSARPTPPIAPGQYRFSPEEMAVLSQCNQESFFKRSVPLGTIFGLGAFVGVQRGFLKPNSRFGAFPKVSLAVVVGYFLGKLSYQQKCAEKLMALPNSYIGQLLRDKREGRPTPPPSTTPNMYGATSSDIYSDAGPGSSLNLDTDRPLYDSDSYRPDSGPIAIDPPTAKAGLSYDELRKSNRDKFYDTKPDPHRISPPSQQLPAFLEPQPESPRQPAPPLRPTNKYGDAID